ncbi:MAG: hypothetical protein IJJ09_03810, partial [Synergistaceae bacterium]|nr:hypothetical protein [Synergistaceae bacterium]
MIDTFGTLRRGMEVLTENMGIVEAEEFIFLIKSEHFDYTEWQRRYFDNMTLEELKLSIEEYFENHEDLFHNA